MDAIQSQIHAILSESTPRTRKEILDSLQAHGVLSHVSALQGCNMVSKALRELERMGVVTTTRHDTSGALLWTAAEKHNETDAPYIEPAEAEAFLTDIGKSMIAAHTTHTIGIRQAWVTEDGKAFDTKEAAEEHAKRNAVDMEIQRFMVETGVNKRCVGHARKYIRDFLVWRRP